MASSYGSDASKSALQDGYLRLCKAMPKAYRNSIDRGVLSMLRALDLYRDAGLVLVYVPFHEEIDTRPVIGNALGDGKRVAAPVFDSRTASLDFYEITSADQIVPDGRGMRSAPTPDARPLGVRDFLGSVCLVPGLVFDGEGYRVGYGAGYYDRFLQFYPGNKVGLVRSLQVSSNPLPRQEGDVAVDVLVSEGSIWRCRKVG